MYIRGLIAFGKPIIGKPLCNERDCVANDISKWMQGSKHLYVELAAHHLPYVQGALLQCGLILLSGLLLWAFRSEDGGYGAIQ